MKTNVTSIMRTRAYEKFWQGMIKHFMLADPSAVKSVMQIVHERNVTGQTRSKDGEARFNVALPKQWFWHPAMSQCDTTMMTKEEREDYWTAARRVIPRFAHDTKKRGMIVL